MQHFFKDLKLHFLTLVLFGIIFPLLIWIIGLIFPVQAEGLPVYQNGKLAGFENIGQNFYSEKYFWGRPSAIDYNAASAAGSNKGPANPEYLTEVEKRIKHFLRKNPGVKRSEIPSELVTASGGGLDPHISPQAAFIQVPRVAKARGISNDVIKRLVQNSIEPPLLNMFGPSKINVLKLNLELDGLQKTK